jgi:protein TonB
MSEKGKAPPSYQPASMTPAILRVVIYASALTLAIMFLIPFTQYITSLVDGGPDVVAVDVLPPPPPPPPEMEEPPEEPPPEEPPPEMSEPPPPLSLSQLDVALEAGVGDAMAGSFGFGGFAVQPDALADMQLFDVRDLDEAPRRIVTVNPEYPFHFKQERIKFRCVVHIIIDERGNVEVSEIQDLKHNDARQPMIEALEKWKYTPPKKNGEPVRAKFFFTMGN